LFEEAPAVIGYERLKNLVDIGLVRYDGGQPVMLASTEAIDTLKAVCAVPGPECVPAAAALTGVPVIADATLPSGAWKIKRGDRTVLEGNVLGSEG
jgi:hypothetical protein